MINEQWKQIKDFVGYEVSNFGRIRSFKTPTPFKYKKFPKIKKLLLNNSGYLYCILYKNNHGYHKFAHILVAEHFILNINKKPEVNHKDGNKLNNYVNNLEWVTSSENKIHAMKLGLFNPNLQDTKGIKNGRAKLNEEKVLNIRNLLNEKILTQKQMSILFNISTQTISAISNNRCWSHL